MQLLIFIPLVWVGLVYNLPTVTKLRCKDPGPIDHGRRNDQKIFHRVGSVILYQCLPGYKIQGGASLTCKKDGNWTREAPSCTAISCGKPSHITHGNYAGSEFMYRSVVTYKCDVGYKLIGKPQRRCRSNGKWTKKPKCETCKVGGWSKTGDQGNILVLDNALSDSEEKEKWRTLQCEDLKEYPRCQIKRPPRLRNGRVNITDPSYSHGSKLIFECNKDYELVGPDKIRCRKGRWSHRQLPHCKLLACPNPGHPEYGFRTGNDFRIGRSVRFVCQIGTKLTGSAVRTCLKNKQWSGGVAVCDDGSTDCPVLGTPISGVKIGNRYDFGSNVRFQCKEGYILQGSSIRRCMPNGKWNGTQSKCIEEYEYFVKGVDETALILQKNIDKMLQYTCSGINSTCITKGIDTRARAIDLGKDGGLDVLFVFDASSSIKKKEFKLAKHFAIAIVKQIGATWKPKGIRIAAIVYASEPEFVFNLGDHGATSVHGVINKLRKIKKMDGATATRHALEMARKVVFVTEKSQRQRALFIITDGLHNIGGSPYEAASILRDRYNVRITSIGAGKDIKHRELYSIGKEKDDVILVKDYKQLKEAIDKSFEIGYTACGKNEYDQRGRMVGGNRADRRRWPWQTGLYRIDKNGQLKLFCGGALIDKSWVLTTAHCFAKPYSIPEMWTIKVGDYFLDGNDPPEQEVQAREIFIHNYYRAKDYENDIALVKLRRDVNLGPFVRTVCLPKKNEELLEPGNVGFVAGWGHTKAYRPLDLRQIIRSKILLESAFSVQSNELCDKKTRYHFNSTVTFCAGDGKGGNDTCSGDNGGSFVRQALRDGGYRWVTAGLVSWGEGCGWKDKYTYYTRVAPFVDWIKKTIRTN